MIFVNVMILIMALCLALMGGYIFVSALEEKTIPWRVVLFYWATVTVYWSFNFAVKLCGL